MRQMKFMLKQFLKEPMWFKLLIIAALLISIIFSSSYFSHLAYDESISKLAAAIFLGAYGIKFRRSPLTSIILFVAAAIGIYLAISAVV
ncbi:hypothetical protein SAMN05428981_107156 [Bacillus sp. OV194]|nr:hypothetical protein SAMN05428981_107156 [Bacillus sp. OV194]